MLFHDLTKCLKQKRMSHRTFFHTYMSTSYHIYLAIFFFFDIREKIFTYVPVSISYRYRIFECELMHSPFSHFTCHVSIAISNRKTC